MDLINTLPGAGAGAGGGAGGGGEGETLRQWEEPQLGSAGV